MVSALNWDARDLGHWPLADLGQVASPVYASASPPVKWGSDLLSKVLRDLLLQLRIITIEN